MKSLFADFINNSSHASSGVFGYTSIFFKYSVQSQKVSLPLCFSGNGYVMLSISIIPAHNKYAHGYFTDIATSFANMFKSGLFINLLYLESELIIMREKFIKYTMRLLGLFFILLNIVLFFFGDFFSWKQILTGGIIIIFSFFTKNTFKW